MTFSRSWTGFALIDRAPQGLADNRPTLLRIVQLSGDRRGCTDEAFFGSLALSLVTAA